MLYKNQIRIRTWARIYPAGTTRISGKVIYVSRYTFVPNLSSPDDVAIGQIQLEARKQEWASKARWDLQRSTSSRHSRRLGCGPWPERGRQ